MKTQSFVGRKAAAPLFFQLADALEVSKGAEVPTKQQIPPGVIQVDVCQASGELPNRWCPRTVPAWFIPGKSPIHLSRLHHPVMVDKQTGEAVCPPYDNRHEQKIFAFWPSELESLFTQAGLPRRRPPQPPENCQQQRGQLQARPPRITSPLTQVRYTLRRSKPEQSIELAASIDGASSRLYWFADTVYLGSAAPDGVVQWRPTSAGRYQLSAVDDAGMSTEQSIEVTWFFPEYKERACADPL